MTNEHTRAGPNRSLWLRILLVGVTGALPLFVVSMILTHASYSGPIEFAQQERRGNAVEQRLELLFEALPRYRAAARRSLSDSASESRELSEAQRQIDQAMLAVTLAYGGELGRALKLGDGASSGSQRSSVRLSVVQSEWDELKRAPLAVAADTEATSQLLEAVRDMIRYVGD